MKIYNRHTKDLIMEIDDNVNADLRGAYLSNTNLRDADLRNADLSGADLSGAYLRDACLRNTNLSDADLSGSYLGGADLRDAYLHNTDLGDADLCGADFRNAYLGGADLCGADLRGADLHNADLRGADLHDANIKIIFFQFKKHILQYVNGYIKIGCLCHDVNFWIENGEEIGRKNNYSNEEIKQYMNFIKYLANEENII